MTKTAILNIIKMAAQFIAAAYLAIVGYLYIAQDSMIFPSPDAQSNDWRNTPFGETFIQTQDGEALFALHHPATEGEGTIILFHGNASTASSYLTKASEWVEKGFGALLVSYRGYPGSTGKASEQGLHLDAEAAYQFIKDQGNGPIALYGHSLGTGVATKLAAQSEIFALVLEAPYDALENIAANRYPWIPVKSLIAHKFQSDRYIGDVSAPILIMHGDQDDVIPISHGRQLHQAAPSGAKFVELKGARHSNLGQYGGNDVAIDFLQAHQPR